MSSFIIYPAIDLRGGKCVRLKQGDYKQETVFHDDPIVVAKQWESEGATWLHVVDLDGAKEGSSVQADLVIEIAKAINIPVQVGGGLRTMSSIQYMLDGGVARVILGTSAVHDEQFVKEALSTYGNRIVIGIDARDGKVATSGWLETSEMEAEQLAITLAGYGAKTIVFTDISRDGMMQGPNVAAISQLAKASGCDVIASGGVSQQSDLTELAQHQGDGVSGAIIGKALYTGDIKLSEATNRFA
ncbi:1-(5-phosphoribosyl)-5-[(5-phosphoribosylamino)methylideneamino]imidazole-4-carboxamide isomerase [Longirhabdus pacifica]|uniref:1-(5-phosphoribosyl)-5-[(5- phosphoribosylamino)methylideneamino]imidazole-4- carboxamide isomerase n=1 Tax=Longirhabdus pacifica TaxID=2305227 RepID=UPI00197F69BA|nr:1-(5-phosphoribosyl)-5-[(5-phosphoribosylamino)methylideneamino]imidazole-4-carboxamide isomerase [Longirhabdus pacifica]